MTDDNEFRRLLPVHDLPQSGRPFAIEASAEECASLARRFGVPEIIHLRLAGLVRPEGRSERVRLSARLDAAVVQRCVVTLQPVESAVLADVERLYGADVEDEWADAEEGGEVFIDIDDETFAEPLPDGSLDLGEVAAEALALELDPYPRAPDADLGGSSAAGQAPERPLAHLLQARLSSRKQT